MKLPAIILGTIIATTTAIPLNAFLTPEFEKRSLVGRDEFVPISGRNSNPDEFVPISGRSPKLTPPDDVEGHGIEPFRKRKPGATPADEVQGHGVEPFRKRKPGATPEEEVEGHGIEPFRKRDPAKPYLEFVPEVEEDGLVPIRKREARLTPPDGKKRKVGAPVYKVDDKKRAVSLLTPDDTKRAVSLLNADADADVSLLTSGD